MIRFITSLIILITFLLSGCDDNSVSPDKTDQNKRDLSAPEIEIIDAAKSFGFSLFHQINTIQPDENIFISPLSVSMALGMTMNGADNETYEAMRQTLEFEGLTEAEINQAYKDLMTFLTGLDEKVLFEIANSIWYRDSYPVEDLFIQTNRDYFDALVTAMDFTNPSSLDIINNWVSEHTHGKIESIVDEIDPLTVMFLINAIYFKGTWTYEFDPDKTVDDIFQGVDGNLDCKMMRIEGIFDYYQDSTVQVVDMAYGAGDYSMTLCLPAFGTDVNTFIGNLTHERWETYIDAMKADSGVIQMPKYKLEYELKMNDVLKAMGMDIAFSPGQADFSRISPGSGLYIHLVKHKSFIQTDEVGTEAAAVTVVELRETSAGPEPQIFYLRLDRPFFFVIRERSSNAVIFMGKIVDPEWAS